MATKLVSLLLAAGALADTGPYIFRKRQSTCSSDVESCSTAASSASTCCVNRPGGQLLQVQFWDTNPVEGPANSWGIHGLWPDNCDGTYSEDCDSSRDYDDITSLIKKYGTTQLLNDMNTYWNSYDETNEEFWEHEWSTHGTCISTIEPSCYTDYETGIEAVDFFQITVDLFKSLNTYQVLYDAGIVPSKSKTYTSKAIVAAIADSFGQDPVLLCDDDTISQIYYGFYVNGPLLNADFVPASVVGDDSSCPSSGISYPPKSGATTTVATTTATGTSSTKVATTTATSSTSSKKITLPGGGKTSTTTKTATTSTTSSASTATGSSVSGAGYWYAYYDGDKDGCLISAGTWYTSGTCATYHATSSGSGFTMYSSKGDCGVSDSEFVCGSDVTASTFTVVDGYLAYEGSNTFYSNSVASGSTQVDIYTDSGDYTLKFKWSAT